MAAPDPDNDKKREKPPILGGVPLFYTGRAPNARRSDPLPQPVRLALQRSELYDPPQDLVAAVNVALLLRMPLLVTGPPGTGKTELALSVVRELHDGKDDRLFSVTVTSTSDKSDVLYRYDELARLRDAYERKADRSEPTPPAPPDQTYLSLRGLGAAIVSAGGPAARLQPIVPGQVLRPGLQRFVDLLPYPQLPPSDSLPFFLPPQTPPPVVLIDEVDKAPRELPNDLLTELDRMRFDIPELGVRVELPKGAPWPVIVITSNAERPLPDAFLRRCICFHVEPPEGNALTAIIDSKLKALELIDGNVSLPDDVREFAEVLRQLDSIPDTEKPGTARVLDFAVLIADKRRLGGRGLRELDEQQLRAALTALVPTRASQAAALAAWQTWRTSPSSKR